MRILGEGKYQQYFQVRKCYRQGGGNAQRWYRVEPGFWTQGIVAPAVLCGSECTQQRISPLLGKVAQAPLAADMALSVSVSIQKS